MTEGNKRLFRIREPPVKESEKYKKHLNEQQYRAVTHGKGAAIVIAGPGSGKTRVITYRVGWLIDSGVKPQSIVLVTFTKKAAQEMIRRVDALTQGRGDGVLAGTFHHVANRFLRKHISNLKSEYNQNYTILDRSDMIHLMKLIVSNLIPKEERTHYPSPKRIVNVYSKSVNVGRKIAEVCEEEGITEESKVSFVKRAIDVYQTRKVQTNVMDFDDLLVRFLLLLRDSPAADAIKQQIRHVLVDEYQDVNTIQAEIVKQLGERADSVMVVGDDAQSIYAFRGAEPKHMLSFPELFPNVTEYRLEINYRSTPEILRFVNASIAHNKNQFDKTLTPIRDSGNMPCLTPCQDVREEADLTCSRVLDLYDEGVALGDQAILFRAKYHSLEVERACMKYQIPYEMRAGLRFFERAHIKDAMAYLVLTINPLDFVQWLRVLTMHYQVGDKTAARVIAQITESDNPLVKFLSLRLPAVLRGKRVARNGLRNLLKVQQFLRSLTKSMDGALPLDELLSNIVSYVEPLVKMNYENHEDRIQDLHELMQFSTRYQNPLKFLSDVLTMYNLTGTTETGDPPSEDKLILSTIHQAKGLEWDAVYVIRLIEGGLPHARSFGTLKEMEEERRLLYVAATRAKDYLFLTYPLLCNPWGDDEIGKVSRFLEEIREEGVFEEIDLSGESLETTEREKHTERELRDTIPTGSKKGENLSSEELALIAPTRIAKFISLHPGPYGIDQIVAMLRSHPQLRSVDTGSIRHLVIEMSEKCNYLRFESERITYTGNRKIEWELALLIDILDGLDDSQGKECWWPISKVERKMQEQGFEVQEAGYSDFSELLERAEKRDHVRVDRNAVARSKWYE